MKTRLNLIAPLLLLVGSLLLSGSVYAQSQASADRTVHATVSPKKYRFRNISGHPGEWTDEQGREAETISQEKLQAMADARGSHYSPGDWLVVTLAEIGLDERILVPQRDPNGSVFIGEIGNGVFTRNPALKPPVTLYWHTDGIDDAGVPYGQVSSRKAPVSRISRTVTSVIRSALLTASNLLPAVQPLVTESKLVLRGSGAGGDVPLIEGF